MKRYSSAPCLTDEGVVCEKMKPIEEPNTREYLQLALAKVLELQGEIKGGTYTTNSSSDLDQSDNEEDLTKEILYKVFGDLPGTPKSIGNIIERASQPRNSQLHVIHDKRIQLLGYDTCRRAAVAFMKNSVRDTVQYTKTVRSNYSGFPMGVNARNIRNVPPKSSSDHETRNRMLKSLDLHLAYKQRDYTAKLMRAAI